MADVIDTSYLDATSSMRDTTKWLVAFVPATAIIAAGAVVAPRVVDSDGLSADLAGWAFVAALGLAAIVVAAARVLTVQPASFRVLIEDVDRARSTPSTAGAALLDDAVRDGVLYFHYQDLDRLKTAVFDAWVDGQGDPAALAAARELRAYAVYRATRRRFWQFLAYGALGVVALTGSSLGVLTELDSLPSRPAEITEPVAVVVPLTDAGTVSLSDATGCVADEAVLTAIGGTWAEPVIAASGPGCDPIRTWTPSDAELAGPVVPVPG